MSSEIVPDSASGDAHDKPFTLDNGQIRYLYFSFDYIQSAMRISDPDALDLRYTQQMMSFLLFNPDPGHVAVIGLGGGSIVKYCYRQLPCAKVTAVEINPHVIALRDEFCVPRDDARLTIVEGDGVAFVAAHHGDLDALLVDAYDRDGIALTLASRAFIADARASLAPGGMLVLNLAGQRRNFTAVVSAVIDVFQNRVLAMQVRKDEHHILLAFRDGQFPPAWRDLDARAQELRRRHGLDFPAFLRSLEQSARNQQAWALSAAGPLLDPDAHADLLASGRTLRASGRKRARKADRRRRDES